MDVIEIDQFNPVLKYIGRFDIIFNCVGIVSEGTILECDENDWTHAFNINVFSMYHICRLCNPSMVEQRNGSIVNIASVASSLKGVLRRFAYGATKGAVIGLTKTIAADFVDRGVRCNAICPGTVETPSLQERIAAKAIESGSIERATHELISRQPMGRLGHTDEIAALAVYLASDEAAFTTGQCHIIDGGWLN